MGKIHFAISLRIGYCPLATSAMWEVLITPHRGSRIAAIDDHTDDMKCPGLTNKALLVTRTQNFVEVESHDDHYVSGKLRSD